MQGHNHLVQVRSPRLQESSVRCSTSNNLELFFPHSLICVSILWRRDICQISTLVLVHYSRPII